MSEDNEKIIEIGAGMEEALTGGLLKCVMSEKFANSMEEVSKAFKKVDEKLWTAMFKDMSGLLAHGAEQFPLQLPRGFDVNDLARKATGVLFCLNTFEFAIEGFAELMAMKMENEEAEDRFKQDNAWALTTRWK